MKTGSVDVDVWCGIMWYKDKEETQKFDVMCLVISVNRMSA